MKKSQPTFYVSALTCTHDDGSDEACSYRVAWSINPHMKPGLKVDLDRARRQHIGLVRALREAGAHVVTLPFVHGAHDSVFVKDAAVIVDDGVRRAALLGRSLHKERSAEQKARCIDLEEHGVDVHASASVLEGGDVVINGGAALMGYGQRTELSAQKDLERFLGREVTPVELVDPALFHLDMAVSVLSDGTALVCRDAIAPASFQALQTAPGVDRVVVVDRDDALAFALNLAEVDGVVVTGAGGRVASLLRDRGRRVIQVPLDELQKAGGSAACLVCPVVTPQSPPLRRTLLDEHSIWF